VLKLLSRLSKAGLSKGVLERLYKGLFVYSIGFNEMLKNTLRKCKDKFTVNCNIWKVYSILLEFCCKTDYSTLISQVTQKYMESEQKIISGYEKRLAKSEDENFEISNRCTELIEEQQKLKDELRNQTDIAQRLENDFKIKLETHEEEVTLRLKFEKKMNDLHSLHRDLENKYKRALEELSEQENISKLASEDQIKLEFQIKIYKAESIKKETTISSLENQINLLENRIVWYAPHLIL